MLGPELHGAIGATTRHVLLSPETMAKQRRNHPDITLDHYLVLPVALRQAAVLQDTARSLVLVHEDSVRHMTHFKVAIKATACGREMYVVSFHCLRPREVQRVFGRHPLIRPAVREG